MRWAERSLRRRLTLDITPALLAAPHQRCRPSRKGVTVKAVCCAACWSGVPGITRGEHPMTRIRFACRWRGYGCAHQLPSSHPAGAPLTRVALAYIEPRFKLLG